MIPFNYITSGQSHGKGLVVVISNVPAGVRIDDDYINFQLSRRQRGYGRGGRMSIEKDEIEIIGGIINGETTGSPISLVIKNKDYENWKNKEVEPVTRPRPSHADLVGGIKYRRRDLRDVLERSSARETAIRVAGGAIARKILEDIGIKIGSFVDLIGGIECRVEHFSFSVEEIQKITDESPFRLLDRSKEDKIKELVDKAKIEGDTLGGSFTVVIDNVPVGIGSFTIPEYKLDANIAFSMLSIQAIKSIEFGIGYEYGYKSGKYVHDQIFYNNDKGFYRKTNYAGGIEGGMANGQRIYFRCYMKPIPTLMSPLLSVDIDTKESFEAIKERSDIMAVPAASVVAENVVAIDILRAIMYRYGFDHIEIIKDGIKNDFRRFEWL
ncbi:MAG TPA: chorismate synthase [Spirochaetota bacterium]|nr:chorismate synthase [Spirochaetota bacterium]HOM38548.1 chorismate synthase [Spirochaetota bacterium]HPQ49088.1 chorismate synthase [Spirochaetota bacterium]